MFDGNHRSRRNVNLGSRRVRSRRTASSAAAATAVAATAAATNASSSSSSSFTNPNNFLLNALPDNKTSLLARTEQLRKERHAAAQREQAARQLQRCMRGYLGRKHLIRECASTWLTFLMDADEVRMSGMFSLERQTLVLNFLLAWKSILQRLFLRLELVPPTLSQQQGQSLVDSPINGIRSLLHAYALRLTTHGTQSTTSSLSLPPLSEWVWIHRIILTCLSRLQENHDDNTRTRNASSTADQEPWLTLFQVCQNWLASSTAATTGNSSSDTINTSTDNNNSNNNTSSLLLFSRRLLGETHQGIVALAQATLVTESDVLYQALARHTAIRNCPVLWSAVGWSLGRLHDETSLHQVVQALITPLSPTRTTATTTAAATTSEFQTIVRQLARPYVILNKALPRISLLPLILQCWKDDPALLALTQWLVEGRAIQDLGRKTNRIVGSDSDEEDDDDDDETRHGDAMEVDTPRTSVAAARAVASSESNTATARRWSKPQLSTLSKLDRVARDTRDKWRHAVWASSTTTIATANVSANSDESAQRLALAQKLIDPALWVNWGRTCFGSSSADRRLAESYVQALGLLLPTGLHTRTTATCTVLTKCAFDAQIMQGLWQLVKEQIATSVDGPANPSLETFSSLVVFSNLWAQTLMVVRDEEFLRTYTSHNTVIVAAEVVEIVRHALYQVYWTLPVSMDDIVQSFSGWPITTRYYHAHFFLAGTKIFNALYQRWCRLVRVSPFATEDVWWFPNLSASTTTRVQLNASRQEESDSDDDNAMHISPADVESEALASAFDDPKLSRVLTSIPQAIPFEKRVKLFDSLIKADKTRTQDEAFEMQNVLAAMMRGEEVDNGKQRVEIRREYLYQDAMQQLNNLGPKLRQKVQVSFINQHGAAEAGIDGGGVFKEFLDDLVKDAFAHDPSLRSASANASHPSAKSPLLALFSVTPLETLAVNLEYTHRPDLLPHYEFLGRAIGKAVYEGILVDPQFCLPFLNQLLGKPNSLEDFKNYDPEYYTNLTKLLSMRSSDFASLGLTFEVSIGRTGRCVELRPGGAHQPVTSENAIPYAHLVAHQLLNVQTAAPVRAFLRGFRDLIPAPWVRLFAAHELQKIISGDDRGLDVASLKATMQYAAGYHPSQLIIQWFWEIVEKDFTSEQQCKLLKFMTSCSRQPLLGFNSLEPAPCIQQIRLSEALFNSTPAEILKRAPLPTASTCMNLLKLPNYRSKELMRVKLIAAIEAGAGFELT